MNKRHLWGSVQLPLDGRYWVLGSDYDARRCPLRHLLILPQPELLPFQRIIHYRTVLSAAQSPTGN